MFKEKCYGFIFFISVNFLSLNNSDGARILASVFTPSYSHQVAFRTLWTELDRKGHQIVLITTDPMNNENLKNIREIDVHNISYAVMNTYDHGKILTRSGSIVEKVNLYLKALHDTSYAQLKHPEVQNLIHNETENFDLLMIEVAHPTHVGFIERWKVPLIGLVSLDAATRCHEVMGNSIHPLLNPDRPLSFQPPLNFLERLISITIRVVTYLHGYWVFYPKEDETVREIFGDKSAPLWELIENIDMLFTNVNPIFHNIRAVAPSTIQFGGATHLTSPKPLPEDLKDFLDSSTNGVIYFSLGNNVKSNQLDDRIMRILLETFTELPYEVLWKFEDQELLNKPENVLIKKWVPQKDILRHPKIKLFITQCGLQSMEEAIMSHVPMVGLPFFGDQPRNSAIMQKKGFGRRLNPRTITKQDFKNAISEVLTNQRYKENIMEMANLMSDYEMSGLERAVWWTEYVIRNKGAGHLKSTYSKIPFYQYFLLDVLAFTALSLFIIILITRRLLSLLLCKKK